MDTGDAAAVAAVIVGIAAGLIAAAALVVSYLAWKEARRSADAAMRSAQASEDSARAAAQSAAAEEAALDLTRREAAQRDADRHEQAGPTFLPVTGVLHERDGREWDAIAELQVDGGPDLMNVRVELVPDTSFGTLHYARDGQRHEALMFDIAPGATISVWALPRPPRNGVPPLLLRIIVTDHADPSRTWKRQANVQLRPGLLPRSLRA